MNKGFTLMELLGVIVIVSLLMILLVPNVLEQLNNKKGEVSSASEEAIKSAAELYVDEHSNETISCVYIKTLQNDGKLSDSLIDILTNAKYNDNACVRLNNKTAISLDKSACGSCK